MSNSPMRNGPLPRRVSPDPDVDVLVVGGGSAGVAAAVAAARLGARTMLVERTGCLGGAATVRNVLTYAGLHTREGRQVVFGVADEVLNGLRRLNALSQPTTFTATSVVFEPEPLKLVLDELCASAGVDVRLHSFVVGARRAGNHVQQALVADHHGVAPITASAFVDATGEGDLAVHSGADVRYGNDGIVQNGTLGVRFGGIDAATRIDRDVVTDAVVTAKARGVIGLTSTAGLVARLPQSADVITYLADEAYDARDARDVSRAEASARRQAFAYLSVIRTIKGCEGAYIVSTGPELGSREARHVTGRAPITEAQVLGGSLNDDAVALGCWPVEYHPGVGLPAQWRFLPEPGYYGIELDVLRSRDTMNLYAAGRVIDGDRAAVASARVMGTAFATGQAAGVAAALHGRDASRVSPAGVRRELRRQGVWLPAAAADSNLTAKSRFDDDEPDSRASQPATN